MSERPFPKGWRGKIDALKDKLTDHARQHPESRLTVVPKRNSGPNPCGDKWHLAPQQFQMQAEAEGLLSDQRCVDCGRKVIKSSGELIGTPGRCGPCHGAWQQDEPPSAA